MARIPVHKTYKVYINGQFPRTESGRYYDLKNKAGKVLANVCLCSRKDFKNAQVAARAALTSWSGKTAFNRSQILYRIAEMLEGRRVQFIEELMLQGLSKSKAEAEINLSIDRIIYYAGWCDKFQQLFSTVNPVASHHLNFSVPEPTGTISVIADDKSPLLGLVSVMAPIIAGGNTCVILASTSHPLCAVTLCEVLATADLPAGVVNVLTGTSGELHAHFSSHMDVNAMIYCRNNKDELKTIQQNCSLNVKRFFHWNRQWSSPLEQNPYLIFDLQEVKTTWHPLEMLIGGSAKY